MNATPFSRTIAGAATKRCRWCKSPMEYLHAPLPVTAPPRTRRVRIYVCPWCDNLVDDPTSDPEEDP